MTKEETEPLVTSTEKLGIPAKQGIALRFYTIIPIVILTFLSVGLEMSTSTQWIQYYIKTDMFHDDANTTALEGCTATNHSDPNYIAYEKVQAESAKWQLIKTIVGCTPAFFANMVLPTYSDSLGRRFLFIIGLIGCLVHMVLQAITVYLELELYCFVAGSFIAGLTGGMFTIISACSSYLADITKRSGRRTIAFSIVEGLVLVCVTVSSILCGYMIIHMGYVIPFAAGSIMLLIALLLAIFCLPESHEKKDRLTSVNIFKTIARTFEFYRSPAFRGRRLAYILLLLAFFFQEITTSQRSPMETLYQLGMPLCWTADMVGLFTALRHAAQAFTSIVLIVPIKACMSEISIAIWSTLFNAGSFVMEGLVQTDVSMYLVAVPATLSFLTLPMIKVIMSIITPPDKQGALFASVSAVQSICGIVGVFVINSTYAATVSIMNGFVFLVLALMCVFVFGLLCVFRLTQKSVYQRATAQQTVEIQNNRSTPA